MQVTKSEPTPRSNGNNRNYPQSFLNSFHTLLINHYVSVLSFLWLLEKVENYKLWSPHPTFPTVPVAEFLLQIPPNVHYILFYLSLALMCIIVIKPKINWVLPALLITEICACLLDQNRWNPWEYEFIFIMMLLIINRKNSAYISVGILLMLFGIYFYSGSHKLNSNFLYATYTDLGHSIFKIPFRVMHNTVIYHSGYIIGISETLSAIGLLFPLTQKKSAQFIIFMHLVIVFSVLIFPQGYYYKLQILPWNIVNIILLYVFFVIGKTPEFHLKWFTTSINPLIILCFWLLPVLSFWDYWEYDLSFKLYAGKFPKRLVICISDTSTTTDMRQFYSEDVFKICNGDTHVLVTDWSYADINIDAYPETRVYKAIKKFFIARHPNTHCSFFLLPYSRSPYKQPIPF